MSKTLCLRHLKKLVKKIEIFRKEDQEKEIQIIPENSQVMSKYGELLLMWIKRQDIRKEEKKITFWGEGEKHDF